MSHKDDARALPEGDGAKVSLDLGGGEGGSLGSPQGASFNPNLLGLDKDDDAAPDLFAKKASPYRGQTMFIAVVLVMGAGAIFGMRQIAVTAAKAGEMFNLNFQPEAEDAEMNKKFNRVMQDLERSGRPMQVPIDAIAGSPFQFVARTDVEPEPGEDPSLAQLREMERQRALDAEKARQAAAARDAKIQTALKKLQLQGILGGSTPVARISDQTFREGDTIEELFTIARIEGRGVILQVDDRYFVLQIGREPREVNPE
ncbi:MAG: hypothetical protein R3B57_00155 [Phycisphaerales bacterium]